MANTTMTPDVYSISESVLDLQKKYMKDMTEETLITGIDGFMNAIFTKQIKTSIEVGSEMANEAIATKARLDEDITAHAIFAGITDINAVPATMDVRIALNEDDVLSLLHQEYINGEPTYSGQLIIDRKVPFYIKSFEYHLDYDIILSRDVINGGNVSYTALYDYDVANANRLSDVSNPNINPPIVIKKGGKNYILFDCILRQIEMTDVPYKFISSNEIMNKTFEFEFDNQLADFEVKIIDSSSNVINIVPLLDNQYIEGIENIYYCRYNYQDSDRIRIIFDSDSYMPTINSEMVITVKTTKGSEGVFNYGVSVSGVLESTERFDYGGLEYFLMPLSPSVNGKDRASISYMRKRIPAEMSYRGNLVTDSDLNTYFETFDTNVSKFKFLPKVDNQNERSFYGYLAIKNSDGNIVPANTINIKVGISGFNNIINSDDPDTMMMILNQGTIIEYGEDIDGNYFGNVIDSVPNTLDEDKFYYVLPFKIAISYKGPMSMYYLNTLEKMYKLSFDYINKDAKVQFIASVSNMTRGYVTNNDKYVFHINLIQNIQKESGIVDYSIDENTGEVTINSTTSKVIAVLYNADGEPYRYSIGSIYSFNPELFSIGYKFEFETNDIINEHDEIRINNTYPILGTEMTYGYLPKNTKMVIYVLNKFYAAGSTNENPVIETFGIGDIDAYVPQSVYEDYTVTNKYSVVDGISFYDNYSDIVSSVVTVEPADEEDEDSEDVYTISSVPVIGMDFASNEDNIKYLINELKFRGEQITKAVEKLNYLFGIDMKFYNTYGNSKLYTLDQYGYISIGNISLHSFKFVLSLLRSNDDYTKGYIIRDVKNMIEDMSATAGSIHIPYIVSVINQNYANSIRYFEFVGFNNNDTKYQHLYYKSELSYGDIPEMINIAKDANGNPDITIDVV